MPAVKQKRRGAKDEDKKPRYQLIEEKGGEPMLPNPGEFTYLTAYWRAVGVATSGGWSLTPLTASELLAWQNGTHTPLSPWEFQIILDISRNYSGFLRTAESPDCLPPYGHTVLEIDKAEVSKRLGAAFSAMARRGPAKKRSKA